MTAEREQNPRPGAGNVPETIPATTEPAPPRVPFPTHVGETISRDAMASAGAEVLPRVGPARDTVIDSGFGPATTGAVGQPSLTPGRAFGKYLLLEELGRGGMGVVFRARDRELGREVAIKTAYGGEFQNPEVVERLLREARIAAQLEHPGIVPVHDLGCIDGVTYFAMGVVRGKTLHDLLYAGPPLTVRARAGFVQAACEAVAYAHEHQVIHRDLKPANVMVTDAGQVLVMDFGLSRRLDDKASRLTVEGQQLGTYLYMPPEQIDGLPDQVGPASDVYSLGALLYEALTGRAPFEGGTLVELMEATLYHDPKPPRQANPRVPMDLQTICLKALAKERSRRYPTARELADDLRRHLEGEAILARRESWWEPGWRWVRRRPGVSLLTAAVLLGAILSGFLAVHGERQRRETARLQLEVLDGLRESSATNLHAALVLRRNGVPTGEAVRTFLPRLESAADRAIRQSPDLAEPHYHLGSMYRALMRFEEAGKQQRAALAKDPGYAPSLYEHCVLLARLRAEKLRALRDRWTLEEGARLAGAGALAGGGLQGTRREMPADADLLAGDAEARGLEAELQDQLDRLMSALEVVPAVPRRPGRPPSLSVAQVNCAQGLHRASSSRGSEDRREAEKLFRAAMVEDPLLVDAYEGLGSLLASEGSYAAAVEAYAAGAERDRGYRAFPIGLGVTRSNWGNELRRQGQDPVPLYRAAVADLDRALALEPDHTGARTSRAGVNLNWALHRIERGEDPATQSEAAIADLDLVLQSDPRSALAWRARGLLRANWANHRRLRGEDPVPLCQAAIDDLDRAVALQPESAGAWTDRARARGFWALHLARKGEDPAALYEAALLDCNRAIESDSRSVEAWSKRGEIRVHWGTHRMLRGEDPEPLFVAAVADYERALEIGPNEALLWAGRGGARLEWGTHRKNHGEDAAPSYEAAIADFTRSLDLHARNSEGWSGRGLARWMYGTHVRERGGDPDALLAESVADYGKALELTPTIASAWCGRAGATAERAYHHGALGRDPGPLHAAADADYEKAIERGPGDHRAWQGRGFLRFNRGRYLESVGQDPTSAYETANADFDKAIALESKSADSWRGRGASRTYLGCRVAARGGDPEPLFRAALDDFGHAIASNGRSVFSWTGRGALRASWAEYRQNRGGDPEPLFAEAMADYDRALELNPRLPLAWKERGSVWTNRGIHRLVSGGDPEPQFVAAIPDYDRSIELNPMDGGAWMARGNLRAAWAWHRRRYGLEDAELDTLALADLDKAIERLPRDAEARWRRGMTHFYLDHWAEAIADFERARQLAPGSEPQYADLLAHARTRTMVGPAGAPWWAALDRGKQQIRSKAYRAAGKDLESGLAGFQQWLDALPPEERASRSTDPVLRSLRWTAHYCLACVHALASVGRDGPDRTAEPVDAATAERLRAEAFEHLSRAIDLGWRDRAHLEKDSDLEALRTDPRWAGTAARMTEGGE